MILSSKTKMDQSLVTSTLRSAATEDGSAATPMTDAALILLAHGSSQTAGTAAVVYQHAAELRRRNCFTEVREAFWKQPPQIAEVLSGVTARRVFIVPLFISEGYFSEQIIPRALGFGNAA